VAAGNIYRKYGKFGHVDREIRADRHRQTDTHAYHSTPLPYWGGVAGPRKYVGYRSGDWMLN